MQTILFVFMLSIFIYISIPSSIVQLDHASHKTTGKEQNYPTWLAYCNMPRHIHTKRVDAHTHTHTHKHTTTTYTHVYNTEFQMKRT
mmetsp:Transcript_39720/g.64432  ORF Transcript_39720/g.64432 Transcript_39720/m.64432 type:complete len:87 (-) Transcript_39720:2303-2563(-)